MLKIRDDVPLEKLKDFGFEHNEFWKIFTKKVYLKNDDDNKNFYEVNEKTRIIELTRLDGDLDNTLYDLITAGLVEKC